ncbi:hypothetical protein DASC09_009840 [Saccharomycopsis crataegensis]|uniref:Uncharacterized protein n=1 Tax=Saccharomycopsis crataegensis TaxID=43959 RepID=A0AAV5QH33_9ASCO|nr:hypothetical protein DASC09_009840 [Saccharomycopsis crataegensis]
MTPLLSTGDHKIENTSLAVENPEEQIKCLEVDTNLDNMPMVEVTCPTGVDKDASSPECGCNFKIDSSSSSVDNDKVFFACDKDTKTTCAIVEQSPEILGPADSDKIESGLNFEDQYRLHTASVELETNIDESIQEKCKENLNAVTNAAIKDKDIETDHSKDPLFLGISTPVDIQIKPVLSGASSVNDQTNFDDMSSDLRVENAEPIESESKVTAELLTNESATSHEVIKPVYPISEPSPGSVYSDHSNEKVNPSANIKIQTIIHYVVDAIEDEQLIDNRSKDNINTITNFISTPHTSSSNDISQKGVNPAYTKKNGDKSKSPLNEESLVRNSSNSSCYSSIDLNHYFSDTDILTTTILPINQTSDPYSTIGNSEIEIGKMSKIQRVYVDPHQRKAGQFGEKEKLRIAVKRALEREARRKQIEEIRKKQIGEIRVREVEENAKCVNIQPDFSFPMNPFSKLAKRREAIGNNLSGITRDLIIETSFKEAALEAISIVEGKK